MKTTLTSVMLLLAAGTQAQVASTFVLDSNQVRATVSNNGRFFNNNPGPQSTAGYEVPIDSNVHAIYLMTIMAGGNDGGGNLKTAIADYYTSDFFFGPVTQLSSQYDTPSYQQYSTVWPVSKPEITYHINNWTLPGYIVPDNIAKWPGNGDVSNGEPALLAPFYDVNGDDIYEPAAGDYPIIRGDKAVLAIMNDMADIHPSGGSTIGLEAHMLFYQYDSPGALGNVTFVHTELINRGGQSLQDFYFGSLIDFDLGGFGDDYLGTSLNTNMAYAYNGDLFDGPSTSSQGFGAQAPAIGVMTVNKPLYSHVSLLANLPNTASQHYNLLQGKLTFGDDQLDNNGAATRYVYNGYGYDSTAYTETNAGAAPGDRRSYISFEPVSFNPGNVECYDYAIVYARKREDGLYASTDSLLLVAQEVQTFYDAQNEDCYQTVLGTENLKPAAAMSIYPNPATDRITLSGLESGSYEIFSTDGKLVAKGSFSASSIDVSKLDAGSYLVQIESNGAAQVTRFVIQ